VPLLLDISDAPEVRAAIGTQVTTADVADSTVMLDVYAGVASDRVLELRDALNAAVPNDHPLLRRATVYLTAALIAPTVPHVLSERTPDYQFQQQALPDPTARIDQLQTEAYNAVLLAAGVDASVRSFTPFDTAQGGRGWLGRVVTETNVPGVPFFA
jgi:hypothetical protein